jgi:phytoene/squalene synthetase
MEVGTTGIVGILNTTYIFSDTSKADARKFYDFIRIINNLVEQGSYGYQKFKIIEQIFLHNSAIRNLPKNYRDVVANVKDLCNKYEIDRALINRYLSARSTDFASKTYVDDEELEDYMKGAGDSVGLILARIFHIDNLANDLVCKQSRAIIYLSFVRNLGNDTLNERFYFPTSELRKYGLTYPTEKIALKYPGAYREFIEAQLDKYTQLQNEATGLCNYLPYSKRVALKTTIDINNWEKNCIAKDPFRVFDNGVIPSRFNIFKKLVIRLIHA